MTLLNVPLFLQKRNADCLAACGKMACLYLGKRVRYGKIRTILNVRAIGTSFYNLRHLSQLDLLTTFHHGSLEWLEDTIRAKKLVIIQYPAFADSPLQIDRVRFEFAWMARDYLCATIDR